MSSTSACAPPHAAQQHGAGAQRARRAAKRGEQVALLQDPARWPLALYLASADLADAAALAVAMAASLVMLAPAALIFRFGQPYLELGIQASGIKE